MLIRSFGASSTHMMPMSQHASSNAEASSAQAGGRTSPFAMYALVSSYDSPSYGFIPMTTKKTIRPQENTSDATFGRRGVPLVNSGAAHSKEPPKGRTRPLSTRDKPKSTNFACARVRPATPGGSTKMLVGFKSPCTITGRCRCKYCNALLTPNKTVNRSTSEMKGRVSQVWPSPRTNSSRAIPATNSNTSAISKNRISMMAP
mmetsp:Transcript_114512/g.330825  ORF Transcript_114512/g.330825 Transcript_114512/m.330825 type:complete len:203 (-) Transcript_114512:19-627(-)